MHKDVSVFTAEAQAIKNALAFAERRKDRHTLILSDSLSVLTSLSNLYCTDPRILSIKDGVDRLVKRDRTISFLWVPSHIGIRGNEAADQLAKDALSLERVSAGSIPHSDLRGKMKRHVREEWQYSWSRLKNTNKLNEIKPTLGPRPSYGLKRSEEVILSRLRIGHTALTHKHLLEKDEAPCCVPCNCVLTVKHILVECPHLETVRGQHFGTRDMRELFERVDPRTIFKYMTSIRQLGVAYGGSTNPF